MDKHTMLPARPSTSKSTMWRLCQIALLVSAVAFSCFGQDLPATSPPREAQAIALLAKTLGRAHVSGSLEYTGTTGCEAPNRRYPAIPKVREVTASVSPRDDLQKMFQEDPKMRVTEEPRGIIRMVDSDVSTDILDLTIRHITFDADPQESEWSHGPNMALMKIISSPEVRAFKKLHNVSHLSDSFPVAEDAGAPDVPLVTGSLDDVTVSQALDYILKTFPGFWIYSNCPDTSGGRRVFFWFVKTAPPAESQ